jgi:hypothetical protein
MYQVHNNIDSPFERRPMQRQALFHVQRPLIGPIPQQPLRSHGVLHITGPMQRRPQFAIAGFDVRAIEQEKVQE